MQYKVNQLKLWLRSKSIRESRFLHALGLDSLDELEGEVPRRVHRLITKTYGGIPAYWEPEPKIVASTIDLYQQAGEYFRCLIGTYYDKCKSLGQSPATLTGLLGQYQHLRCNKGELLARDKMLRLARLHGVTVDDLLGFFGGREEIDLPTFFEREGAQKLSSIVSKQYYPIVEGTRFPGWNVLLQLCHEYHLSVDYALHSYYNMEDVEVLPYISMREVMDEV